MGLLVVLSTTALAETASFAQAQTVPLEETSEPSVDIPVEVPVEPEPGSLTNSPDREPLQVPSIVPIPPSNVPVSPLYPAPGPLQEGAVRDEDTYTLGAGDEIVVDIFDVPEFSGDMGTYTLLVDGSVVFPWIGRISLQGLTLEEAANRLEREYGGRGYIVNPLITVNLLTPRSLRVSIVGEVTRPGAYSIAPTGEATSALSGAGPADGPTAAGGWPTVTQAIQAAGGITQLADLRNVQIRRPLRDGSENLVDINLWELIRTGQLTQDITLRDGDTLVIPTATDLSSDEAILVGSASFAPGTITVNVVGEVVAPGPVEVPPNTSLNQVIQAAGGFDRQRARTGRVELIRLNPNGTAVRRRISTDFAAGINEESNPALRNGDTVIIGRSGVVSVADTLDTILRPLGTVLGTLDIFGIFRD